MTSRVNLMLHRFRTPMAAIALLFILYCNVYMWFYVPPDDYEFTWSPDTQLRILSIPEDSLARPFLQPDDIIVAIDGRPVQRMGKIYSTPLQEVYRYTLQREGVILAHDIPVPGELTALALKNQLPTTLLSLVGWTVAALLLFFARRDNVQAIHAGYIFLLAPVVLVGIQAGQDGTPFAWLGGQALVFFLLVAWPYLGLIPRHDPLGTNTDRILKILAIMAAGFSLVAIFEVLSLYPRSLSIEEFFGISMYSSGFVLAAMGLVAFVVLLWRRAVALPESSYLRQQLIILLVFVAIGVIPIVFLTILPGVLLQTIFLPFPIAIALMSFIPAGYLFVIYRRGFLGLDPFFSRTMYFALLALIIFGFYIIGLYVVQRLLNLSGPEAILPATVVFFPTLILAIYLNHPINVFVQQIIYGRLVLNQETLAAYMLALSSKPELSTLDNILTSLADLFNSSEAALIVRNEAGQYVQISTKGTHLVDRNSIPEFNEPIVRATISHQKLPQVLTFFKWAELAVPLMVREEQIGVLALSRPGEDGYFNAKQVTYLMQAAGMLAVANENIRLFEATCKLSMRAQVAQEKERQRLALRIHDAPLQEITFVTNTLDHLLLNLRSNPGTDEIQEIENATTILSKTNEHLREAAKSLRDICIGLYPPLRDQGIHLLAQSIVNEIREKYQLEVELKIDNILLFENAQGGEDAVNAVSQILSEALTNVAKHVSGARVCVWLRADEQNLYLSVIDNGPGVPIRSLSEMIRQDHLGIVGMRNWASIAGGHLQLREVLPQGLEVLLTCPLLSPVS